MVIAIVGGGNIGTLMAGEFAAAGHEVRVVTSNPPDWCGTVNVLDRGGEILVSGELTLVTENLSKAIDGADYIWITYPTFMLEKVANDLLPLVEPHQRIGVVPGNGAEFFFGSHVRKGAVLFGLQRVHSIARLCERGHSVYMLGRKQELQVASLPSTKVNEIAYEVEGLFGIPAIALPHYLAETLTPSNPILHTSRIRSMFRNWKPGVYYSRNVLFYEDWDNASSELMLTCDTELQQLCRLLESKMGVDLSGVKSLKDHYDCSDALAITAKISNIPAFRGLTSPMREVGPGMWEPDFSSRYFKADFAYGLKVIVDIAELVEAPSSCMREVFEWYEAMSGDGAYFDGMPATFEEFELLYV